MAELLWAGHTAGPFLAPLLLGADTTDPSSVQFWLQWGAIGVMAFLLMSGKFLAPRYVLDRETARADRMEAALLASNALLAEKHLPALESSKAVAERSQQVLQDAMQLVRDMQRDRERERDRQRDRGADPWPRQS